jgi:GT2 family glycosyltransferase/2-polyprenyl-3-methyl-5-hydroxy-6-metoxy-1,4-benzoquinol methylase/tetratricopeptide (TPR) repeat protein
MGNPKILLVQLEFGTWAQAKAWSYVGNFAVEDGLLANGCECVVLPALCDVPDTSPQSWLHYAKDLVAGQRFDQVWVWLVHNRYSDAFLDWIAELAPVRVGLVMESLRYGEQDYRRWPHLRERAGLVQRQVRRMTHVLAADERDAEMLNDAGLVQAMYWPAAMPARYIASTIDPPSRREAAFYGELYGERSAWLAIPGLKDLLVHPPSAETATEFPRLFDALHRQMTERVQAGWRPDRAALAEYVSLWRRLREGIFANWLASLKTWSAIVNLPSLFQAYAGRVIETMAAGRPVISWEIPDRPRTKALFREGREILLYPKDRPAVLAEHLTRVAHDSDYALEIATAARTELLRSHTAERQASQILRWLENRAKPEYGTPPVGRETLIQIQSASSTTKAPPESTTVFVLTVGDPAVDACKKALTNQSGTRFRTTVLKDICPFSAAAQKMITDCATEFFIQVDEDMILQPDAVATMEAAMQRAPKDVGMIYFHLYDEDRECPIQGVKIYRTELMKRVSFRDLKASEMNLLDQMGEQGIRWTLHPDVLGRHGTVYTPETIYRRYKTMYEKDIRQWNCLTSDVRQKADRFRETGDPLQLFALLGAVHGIVGAPHVADREKDARRYNLKELDVFKRLFFSSPPPTQPYDSGKSGIPVGNPPIPFDQVQWNHDRKQSVRPDMVDSAATAIAPQSSTNRPISSLPSTQSGSPSVTPLPRHIRATPSQEDAMDQDRFYVDMFVNSPAWSTPEPNSDEAARWSKIASFLEHILRRIKTTRPDATLRILEVGCGRGWLSNLASQYGTVEGIEPVAGVVDHARKMFPHIRFEAGTAETVLRRRDFAPYDVVLCSEVIEHVPDPQKPAFLDELRQLLAPEGYVILTTPRGEMWERWKSISPPSQPVEDWITEQHLEQQCIAQGLMPLGLERIYVEIPTLRYIPAPTPHDLKTMNLLPIYQVWVAQRAAADIRVQRQAVNRAPMVSVIIPTHNRPDRLRTALASVIAQEYRDFQIIVVNDGATPVESVIAAFNHDGRITLINHDRNKGLAASRNTGLRQATGKYVCYLDDDDRFLPDHLRTLVTQLETGDCKVAYTDAWRVHEQTAGETITEITRDRPYADEFNPHQLLIGNYIPVLCVMHARACLDEVGCFDESLFVHEDWDLWIRMATRYPFTHIPKTTAEFTWRVDGSSMTSQSQEAFLRTTEIIYRKYAPYAAKYPAVFEGQQNRLRDLKRTQAHKRFTCSIIIPVWNKVELTRQCLIALGPATEDVSFELIIVDNHSTDGTPEFLASLGGDVRIITNDENLGFAKACNQGAAVATGEYLVFLNNDTIPLKGWLSALVEEVRTQPDVTVVGSKLLYEDGTVQHAGVAIDRHNLTPYHIYNGFAADHPAVNKRRELNAVTGACLLIRRSVFSELGGFDEGFVNGFEDVDLCFRVREKQGRIVYQPHSVLYHLESQTPGRKQHDQSNARRLNQRWGHCWWLIDDDSIYAGDGYKAVGVDQKGIASYELHLIDGTEDRRAWDLVATMQRAAHDQDLATVEVVLKRHAEWPADSSILQWAASVAKAMKLPGIAEEYRRRVERLNDPAFRELEEIRAALAGGQLSMASSRVDALLTHYPAHAEALLLRAILHMQREQYREAEIVFTTALNQGANRKKCLMGIGMASMGRAYPQGAWQTFLRVLAENPDDADVIHWLLRAGTAQNRWRELSVQLHNYLARNPSDLSVRFAYAGVLLRADQVDASRQEYDQLRALAPAYEGLAELGQAIAAKESVLAMNVSNA